MPTIQGISYKGYKILELKMSTKNGHRTRKLKDRRLFYPQVHFRIAIDVPSFHNFYVAVRTKVLDDIFDLGVSETLHSTDENSMSSFKKEFSTVVYSGIDDNQKIIVEVWEDNDLYVRNGYVFSSVQFDISNLEKSRSVFDLNRSDSLKLGSVYIFSSYDVKLQVVSLSTINNISSKFLRSRPPSAEDMMVLYPSFLEKFLFYNIDICCDDICPYEKDVMRESGFVFVRMCVCPDSSKNPWSEDLKFVWQSVSYFEDSNNINVVEIKISHESFVGRRDIDFLGSNECSLVVQVYIGGLADSLNSKPRCCSYCIIPMKELLIGGTFSRNFECNREYSDNFPTKAEILVKKKLMKNSKGNKNLLPLKKKKSDNKSPDQVVDDLLNRVCGVAMDTSRTANDNILFDPAIQEELNIPLYGTMKITVNKELMELKLSSGDDIYQEKIREVLREKTKVWVKRMQNLFMEACDFQSRNLNRKNLLMQYVQEGYTICPMICLDMHFPCLQHFLHVYQQRRKQSSSVETLSKESEVLNAFIGWYKTFQTYFTTSEVSILAGGGIFPATKAHPNWNFPRNVAFPLVQESLLKHAKDNGDKLFREIVDYKYLLMKKFNPQNEEDDDWGGFDYHQTMKYRDLEHIMMGFQEASVIYEPYVEEEDLDALESLSTYSRNSTSEVKNRLKLLRTRVISCFDNNAESLVRDFHDFVGKRDDSVDSSTDDQDDDDDDDDGNNESESDHDSHFLVDLKAFSQLISSKKRPFPKYVCDPRIFTHREYESEAAVYSSHSSHSNSSSNTNSVHVSKHSIPRTCFSLVWIIGKTIKNEDLRDLKSLLNLIEHSHFNITLSIILAAELRPEMSFDNEHLLKDIARPFGELKSHLCTWLGCDSSFESNESPNHGHPNNNNNNKPGQKNSLEFDFDGSSLRPHRVRSSKIAIFHRITWSEVMASCYLYEDWRVSMMEDAAAQDVAAQDAAAQDTPPAPPAPLSSMVYREADSFKLPSIASLRAILGQFLSHVAIERILDSLYSESSERIRNFSELSHIRQLYEEELEVMMRHQQLEHYTDYITAIERVKEELKSKKDQEKYCRVSCNLS